ncbi:TIGR00269 family protein [Candidatus Woesearchaeota archaeon]|nr:TIGR00269 family protein [Candidatus Woesearchaeota archaeon]
MKKCIKCGKRAVCSDLCRSHFIDYFENKVRKTIRKFKLLTHQEKIGVAVSGGKDSTVILYILHKLKYKPIALTVDALIGNYTKENLKNLRSVCKKYKIPLNEISFKKEFGYSLCYLKSVLNSKGHNYSSCMVCGILRRFLLNKYAKKHKLDVLVTGHNLDDEAQAFLMNVFRNDPKLARRQGPITGSKETKAFVKRVKPLYLCSEKEAETYSKLMKFPVHYTPCPCRTNSYRKKFLDMLNRFEKDHKDVKYKIVRFFLETVHKQKDKIEGTVNECTICEGPASKEICKKCEIILSLKNKPKKKKCSTKTISC